MTVAKTLFKHSQAHVHVNIILPKPYLIRLVAVNVNTDRTDFFFKK